MKDTILLIFYQLVYLMAKCLPARPAPKHLLLVKTDEIGDYILVRNLLVYFKTAGAYKDYTITLVGNSIYKQVFDAYDANTVDNVIWIDKRKFRRNLFYRLAALKKVRSAKASVAISLIYSRRFRLDDVFIAVSGAGTTIGMKTDQRLLSRTERWLTPGAIYTRLIESGEETLFDGYRNARFIARVLDIAIPPASTALNATADIRNYELPHAYFVVFPGSGLKYKKWPAGSFAAVAAYVSENYGLTPVVCGAEGDRADCREFIRSYNRPVIDLTGKTSLPQLLAVLKAAACLISVDTGSVHLAAAVGCPVFALFSGIYYGRFAPYPREIAPYFFPFYPDEVERMIANNENTDFQLLPPDLLNKIPAQKLIRVIKEKGEIALSVNKIQ